MSEFFKNRKILIAGGAGFVGTNLIKRLLDYNVRIRATVHLREPQLVDDRIEFIKCDLTRKEDCRKVVEGMDYVFMCAANTSGAAVMEKDPLVHVTPNIIMNTLMLDAAYQAKVDKFLWLSSNTVYPVADYPVKEEDVGGDLFEKYFCVGWMKRFTEILCQMYAEKIKNPMKVGVIRPANIYGPYDDFEWETSHVLPALMRKVAERHDPIEVWGDG
ncbi:MAG: NAD-dependent epimerase/dehydratase family protein, partial [Candidatus Omnitrophota bacterium]